MLALVKTIRFETEDVISVELCPNPSNSPGPTASFKTFGAGDHIDLQLPNGLTRSYSLMNNPKEQERYVLGILKDPKSRGASKWLHEHLRVGMRIEITAPSNNFPLNESFKHTVLISGGIGVTPIISMAHRLNELSASFEFIYAAKSKASGPYQEQIANFGTPVHWHFDDQVGSPPDLKALIEARIKHHGLNLNECQLYACGPEPMLEAFLKACEQLSLPHAHIERFKAPEVESAGSSKKTYTVVLKKSNKSIEVGPDTTLLQALRQNNINVDTSCEEGVCGACETRVLSGVPEHLDYVLSDQEREKNKVMMVCVSGCKSELLELDL